MLPESFDAALLWDMLRYSRETQQFVAGKTWEEYRTTRLLQAAVERTVLLIGEAAFKISSEFRDAHPQVPWKQIITQRHRLVHDYGRIDDEKIWRVATVHVPILIPQLEKLLPKAPPDPAPEPDEDVV